MRRVSLITSAFAVAFLGSVGAQTPSQPVLGSVFAPPSLTCSASFNSTVTLTGSDNTTPGTADIVIVMDESGSIDSSEWAKWDQFVDAAIDLLDLANSNNRVGLVKYSSYAQLAVPLTQDPTPLKNLARTFPGGSTATAQGIQMARQLLAAHARPGAEKFILVLTDGFCTCSNADILAQSAASEAAGITTIAVGVADAREAELDLIATDVPGVDTSIFVSDFDDLENAVGTLIEAIVTPVANNVTVVVDAMPRFPVSGASASAGTVTVTGGQIAWTLPSLGAGSQTLTINHQHDGSGAGPLQVFSATYSDAENHAVSIDTPSTVVSGCNVAPVANAGIDQNVSLAGALASVTLNGGGSTDDGLNQPLAYAWSSDTGVVAAGVAPTVSLPMGIHTFTLVVNDGQFTDTDSVIITVRDTTAPQIASITPSTASLWPPNNRMVPVSLVVAATDNVSAAPVCSITSVSTSDNSTADAAITGPLTLDLRAEKAGQGNARVYTIGVACTDASGNTASAKTTVVALKSQGKGK